MPTPLEKIIDVNDREITVGSRVRAEEDAFWYGNVTAVSETDVDYSDEAQRAVMYNPMVSVKWDVGVTEKFDTEWDETLDYGPTDAYNNNQPMIFRCIGLEVVDV